MADSPEPKKGVDTVAVIQAVLVAGITAMLVHVFSLPRLEEKIEHLSAEVTEIKAEQRKIYNDLYAPRVNGKLADFQPIEKGP